MADLKTKNASDMNRQPKHRLKRSRSPRSAYITMGALAAVMVIPSAAIPASAATYVNPMERASEVLPLDLKAHEQNALITADPAVKVDFSYASVSVVRAEPEPEPEPEPVVEAAAPEVAPAPAPAAPAAAASPVNTNVAAVSATTLATPAPAAGNASSSSKASAAVASAYAQLGVAQDCTDLVQNALAAAGLTERRDKGGFDRGPGIEQWDQFGTRVSLDNLAPGDILIYGHSHVALYVGNGQAIHGGFNGMNTVLFSATVPGQPLTGAVRI